MQINATVMFIPMSIRSKRPSHLFHRGPAFPSAWTSNSGKLGSETAMRFHRGKRVANSTCFQENVTQGILQ